MRKKTMDKSRANQPLDDFFRRKLENATVKPSADGWSRLESKMQVSRPLTSETTTSRVRPLWYWSAAAACVLIMFWLRPPIDSKQPDFSIASGRKPAQEVPINTPKPALDRSLAVDKSDAVAGIQNERTVQQSIAPVSESKKVAIPKEPVVSSDQHQSEVVAVVEKPVPTVEEGRVRQIGEKNDHLAYSNQNESPLPVGAKTSETERTLIVSVAEPASRATLIDEPIVETSSSQGMGSRKINRMFQQIRRLKNGEGIARANPDIEYDEESGLLDRLVRTARFKDNHSKSEKQ
ncbi:hypothetical protein F5984_05370 [Rudanella paleaurantiibacter]|uniref:Uncharacterized protein n=1 Tax=Rudanella paleaurantiibacter TaxID=2614655 RepID=A0A7J5U1H8_9BACT|nr:hypothetical protein [Rudanella paleaurantiibacter]KAB7731659.1 hypothetical protein F5984_05370 [Rudanella paleaurantiibacter]